MPKSNTIKKLGMQQEFSNWMKQQKTLPKLRVGAKVKFVNFQSLEGYTGVVIKLENNEVWLEYGKPGVSTTTGYLHISNVKDHLRFI